jgi:hypothetical protein
MENCTRRVGESCKSDSGCAPLVFYNMRRAARTAARPGKIESEKAAPLASIATAKIKYNYALKLEEIY